MDAGRAVEVLPATPMQRGMLFHHIRDPHAGIEILQVVGDLAEMIDLRAFERAVAQVVAREGALRSALDWEGREAPLQWVAAADAVRIEIREVDLAGLGAHEAGRRFEAALADDRRRGFDLAIPGALRFALFRMPGGATRLLWSHHHALIDGRSGLFVLDDLFTAYDAMRRGEEADLPARPAFRDHAEALEAMNFDAAEERARLRLHGLDGTSPAPLAAAARTETGHGLLEQRIGAALSQAIREAAQREGVGVSTFLQAALSLVVARATGKDDVVLGQVRSGRYLMTGALQAIGNYINTAALRLRFTSKTSVGEILQAMHAEIHAARADEHLPIFRAQRAAGLPAGAPLFETALIFDGYLLENAFAARGGAWAGRRFRLHDQTSLPLALYAYDEPDLLLRLSFDRSRYEKKVAERLLGLLLKALEELSGDPARCAGELDLLPAGQKRELLQLGEGPGGSPRASTITELVRAAAAADPEREALVAGGKRLSYAALLERAQGLAAELQAIGAGPGERVAVLLEREPDLLPTLLAVLESGAAYVPLDPDYPAERLSFMLEDAAPVAVLVEAGTRDHLPPGGPRRLVIGEDIGCTGGPASPTPRRPMAGGPSPDDPAYVLYTSGSTGRPKGVVVRHRNVCEFFAGLDLVLPVEDGGRFLAVTSISFDISVLELFWSLARGLTVVLQGETAGHFGAAGRTEAGAAKVPEFSLFYFAGAASAKPEERYRLLIEGARLADQSGFHAVWTPERHFHDFGGLYPNPAVAGAALAVVTKNLKIRGGSVVMPLQDPIRVAEEWSVVDNLSQGRAGVSFASGWHAQDFALAPGNYADRVPLLYSGIDQVRALWRGEKLKRKDGTGGDVEVGLHPRPIQPELPFWVTSGGHPDTFRSAGRIGANLLTHLLGQDLEGLAQKIAIYREARAAAGHDPRTGTVTLMVHAHLGADRESVREEVREPLIRYLATSSDLVMALARALGQLAPGATFSAAERRDFLEKRFDRYFEGLGLFGTVEDGIGFVEKLAGIGVDEVACLVDFGIAQPAVMASIGLLGELRRRLLERQAKVAPRGAAIAENLAREKITHLQCTPSLARMLLADPPARAALAGLRHWLIGGEAFPAGLLAEIRGVAKARVLNMYGPTETTIWSAAHEPRPGENPVPIGRALRRQSLRIVDAEGRLLPRGAIGELAIGGAGVAMGYFRREELTAERFIPDPFTPSTTARLYRTGDLARFREDGLVELLGRADSQVKWRGHRIELGEIEAALADTPGIQQAAVLLRQDEGAEPRLVAYLAPAIGAPGDAELRDLLRRKLPEIMIPQDFVRLDAFPLTPNAKIDRRALPRPAAQSSPAQGRVTVPPAGETEAHLLALWRRLLQRDDISVTDDWFELGGHSLLAIQLLAAIRAELEVTLELSLLFNSPTIRSLAAATDALRLLSLANLTDLASLLDEKP